METHFENIENAQSDLARERIASDLKLLIRDSESLLKATANDMTDKVRETRASLAVALERAKITCSEMGRQSLASARAAARRADSTIRQHPYESIGISFGVGLLIGVLVTRR
jgi:ElaB/YqjD/DUF883 family membrane-anchored ribosome-binding protein